MLKKTLAALAIGSALMSAGSVMAADYVVDKEGQHAFVDFKISHLGYSFITGTFKDLDGKFSFDATGDTTQKIISYYQFDATSKDWKFLSQRDFTANPIK